MPLVEGIEMSVSVPKESRPHQHPVLMEDLLRLAPNGNPIARRGDDGTAWCACCDITISPHNRSAFCSTHRKERNTVLRRRARQEGPSTPRTVPSDALDQVVEAADDLLAALGRASMEFPRLPPMVADWVDDLMLATKTLSRAIDSGIRPYSNHRRQPRNRTTGPRNKADQQADA